LTLVKAIPVAESTPATWDAALTAAVGTGAVWSWFWMIRLDVTLRSIEPRNDCLKPLISTEKNTTRPIPIMSAAAVTACAAGVSGGVVTRQPARCPAAQAERPSD